MDHTFLNLSFLDKFNKLNHKNDTDALYDANNIRGRQFKLKITENSSDKFIKSSEEKITKSITGIVYVFLKELFLYVV